MPVRAFRADDAGALVAIARSCARGETDFVLVPLWESERDLFAEFERHGIAPAEHLLVSEAGDGTVVGCAGYVRRPAVRPRASSARSWRATRAATARAVSCCARRSRADRTSG
jgi:hypothetical protein